jgi:hypothetical protein
MRYSRRIFGATVEERFWDKVDFISGDGCWLWTGALTGGVSYGNFWTGQKNITAHRYSYQLVVGEIEKFLDHLPACPKNCVNPSHLRPATHKQNLENRSGAQSNSKSGVRGVFWNKHKGKWHARVTHDGKQYNAGFFNDIKQAEAAVLIKRKELFTHNYLDRMTP